MEPGTTNKKPSDELTEAALLFENGTLEWTKGKFFGFYSSNLCACAHGGIGYCDPKIKDAVLQVEARRHKTPSATDQYKWDDITNTMNHRFGIQDMKNAHDYAMLVGLTVDFNDLSTTTKEQVILKLREAAKLALSEGN